MTPSEQVRLVELVRAHDSGETIEVSNYCGDRWFVVDNPRFDSPIEKYRTRSEANAQFIEALARGERVDFNIAPTLDPGVGWAEMAPGADDTLFDDYGPDHFRIAQPWQDERDAFARGETIQYRVKGAPSPWRTSACPSWLPSWEYRVKPKTIEVDVGVVMTSCAADEADAAEVREAIGKLSVTLAATIEDGKVVSLEIKEYTA